MKRLFLSALALLAGALAFSQTRETFEGSAPPVQTTSTDKTGTLEKLPDDCDIPTWPDYEIKGTGPAFPSTRVTGWVKTTAKRKIVPKSETAGDKPLADPATGTTGQTDDDPKKDDGEAEVDDESPGLPLTSEEEKPIDDYSFEKGRQLGQRQAAHLDTVKTVLWVIVGWFVGLITPPIYRSVRKKKPPKATPPSPTPPPGAGGSPPSP
jgi:hypothetical protein